MTTVELRPPTEEDLAPIARVVDAQDVAWWGAPDNDIEDVRSELARVQRANGSLEAGARVAIADGTIVGMGALVGHGQSSVAVDPASAGSERALALLLEWVISAGATEVDAPSQDEERRSLLTAAGFEPTRSSFDLQRPGDVSDLPPVVWPEGITPVAFRRGVDDEEVHEMVYSFWTDVAGHTYRPIDEWRELFVAGAWFDPELAVLARADEGTGPAVGIALCRTFSGNMGWVSQLGVARSARGVGLGRAILLEACHRLGRTSAEMIGLSVEAHNANALGLYRSVGMDIEREWVHFGRGDHLA